MLTTWPPPWVTICRIARWVMWKNPARFTAVIARVVVSRVVGEGLADEDPGVVDQAVDPPEPVERLLDHALGGLGFGDVTLDGEEVGLVGRARSSARCRRRRTRHDGTRLPAGADALRGAGDDRDLLRRARSSDEVGLVDHAARPAAADADEDALVQPVELGGGGLDLRSRCGRCTRWRRRPRRAPRRASTSALPWRTPRDWT